MAAMLTKVANILGSQKQFNTLDKILVEMQKNIKGLTREGLVGAIVESSTGAARVQTDAQKQLADIKREARKEGVKLVQPKAGKLEDHPAASHLHPEAHQVFRGARRQDAGGTGCQGSRRVPRTHRAAGG